MTEASAAIETDVLIIGAGPVGLFAVFQLGLFDIKCHLVDTLDQPGGQCAVLYPDKPIYDIPAIPSISAGDLVERLIAQIAPFKPQLTFNRMIASLFRRNDGRFEAATSQGDRFVSQAVVVAVGGGSLRPHQPAALMTDWGFKQKEGVIPVDTARFETSQPGIFAIGDISWYPGKVRLILSGFHEAALMAQAARRIVKPGERGGVQYTTSSTRLQKRLGVRR